jgi:hypothetical protein
MEVANNPTWLPNHNLTVVKLIHIISILCGHDRGKWCKRRYRSMSLSSCYTLDNDPHFIIESNCHNNVKMCLDGLLATHTITGWFVFEKSLTLIYIFQTGVQPLLCDVSHPPSHCCKVLNRSLNVNISWIAKRIPHQHSAHHSDCFAPSHDSPTPITWCLVASFCEVPT